MEYRKTKTRLIALANHRAHRQYNEPIKTPTKYTRTRRKAREKVCERVTIGFGFTSDWMKKWREFFKPIAQRSNTKPIIFRHSAKTGLACFYLEGRLPMHLRVG